MAAHAAFDLEGEALLLAGRTFAAEQVIPAGTALAPAAALRAVRPDSPSAPTRRLP